MPTSSRTTAPISYTFPTESDIMSRRDSWPPTQVRLNPFATSKDDPRPLLDDIDEDPLTYFLTPAPGLEDEEATMMHFDAGIEDGSRPRNMVRSVSPSSLDGLNKIKGRPASPDFDSDVPTTDDDEDDDEDYITGNNFKLLTLSEFAIDRPRFRSRSTKSSPPSRPAANHLPSRASFPGPSYRGRTGLRGRPSPIRSLSARARPNHLWREPSPDVWSIEEETEEEMMSEMGNSIVSRGDAGEEMIHMKELNGGKPTKKVRFILPVKE